MVREDPNLAKQPERHRTSWDRLRRELAAWDGDGLVSHEFFAAASPRQAAAMIGDLAPAEVHVVATAREPLGLFTASWQESLKNRSTEPLPDRDVSTTGTRYKSAVFLFDISASTGLARLVVSDLPDAPAVIIPARLFPPGGDR